MEGQKGDPGQENMKERETEAEAPSESQLEWVTLTSGKRSDKQVQPKVNLTLLDHTVSGN